jgi:restriction system protein
MLAIPDYEKLMLPVLKFAGDGKEHYLKDVVEKLAKDFNLTGDEKNRVYETRKVSIFYDRTHWAITYLKQAGLLKRTKRSYFEITDRGLLILKEKPRKIDDRFLTRYSEFRRFARPKKSAD